MQITCLLPLLDRVTLDISKTAQCSHSFLLWHLIELSVSHFRESRKGRGSRPSRSPRPMLPSSAFAMPSTSFEACLRNKKNRSKYPYIPIPTLFSASLTSRSFCEHHQPTNSHDREAWLLQRDITHALILPILEIFRHATNVAKSMLGDRNIFDLELVFRGEARGAFSWLSCFIADEEDWCLTRGCPGTLSSSFCPSRLIGDGTQLASSVRSSKPNPRSASSSSPAASLPPYANPYLSLDLHPTSPSSTSGSRPFATPSMKIPSGVQIADSTWNAALRC